MAQRKGLLKGFLIYGGLTLIFLFCIGGLPQIIPIDPSQGFGTAIVLVIVFAYYIQYDFRMQGNIHNYDLSGEKAYWVDKESAFKTRPRLANAILTGIVVLFLFISATIIIFRPAEAGLSVLPIIMSIFLIMIMVMNNRSQSIRKRFTVFGSGLRAYNYFLPWDSIEGIYTAKGAAVRQFSRALLPFVILNPAYWGSAIPAGVSASYVIVRIRDKKGKLYMIPTVKFNEFLKSVRYVRQGHLLK